MVQKIGMRTAYSRRHSLERNRLGTQFDKEEPSSLKSCQTGFLRGKTLASSHSEESYRNDTLSQPLPVHLLTLV